MQIRSTFLGLICLVFLLQANPIQAQDTKHVLFLGNSYTYYNNLPELVEQIALANGDTLIHDKHTPGGHKLIQHAANSTSLAKIQASNWDHVILQDNSLWPAYYWLEHYTGAEQLIDLINSNSTCLNRTMFYMTWGRQNSSMFPYAIHQQLTTDAYNTTAQIFGAEVSPVGAAWKKVRDDGDPINLYASDGTHPSYAGSYLAACVHYASLFDNTPVGNSFIGNLSASDAGYLQQKAYEAYTDYVALGHIRTGNAPDSVSDVFRAVLTHDESQFQALINGPLVNSSFDLSYVGFSTQAIATGLLKYELHQGSSLMHSDSVSANINTTIGQCNSLTQNFPLNVDLSSIVPGVFTMRIFLNGHQIDAYDLLMPITTAIGSDGSSGDLHIFPNPVRDRLFVPEGIRFEIVNSDGRQVMSGTSSSKFINVSELESGYYLISLGSSKPHRFLKLD